MKKVLTSEEMHEVDSQTTEKYGIPSLLLMENAAQAAARVIVEKSGGSVKGKSVLVLCGKGNNGGDGAALARILWMQGAKVCVALFGKVKETKGDAKVNFEICRKCLDFFYEFSSQKSWEKWYWESGFDWEIMVDALFGTGLNRPIDDWLAETVRHLNIINEQPDSKRLIVSLDIPSGLNSNLPNPSGETFQADLTVTFTAPKLANVFPPASNYNGETVVANIGSPEELIDNCSSLTFLTEKSDVLDWLFLTKVQSNSYKKTRGTALLIAGSESFSGAAVLAANACFASGAGMVTVAVPEDIYQVVAAKTSDEIIVKTLESLEPAKVEVVALGCGLINDAATHNLIHEEVNHPNTPLVLDAEALNALSPFHIQGTNEFPLILTPHIGEFSRLLGRDVGENKVEEVREFAQKHNVILVLKGERTLIGKPDGTVVINPTGTAGVSRAGAGDTLTGIITGFLAQTFSVRETNLENAFEAVVAALYIAGLAGEIAAGKFSERLLTATDVRNCLDKAIERIN